MSSTPSPSSSASSGLNVHGTTLGQPVVGAGLTITGIRILGATETGNLLFVFVLVQTSNGAANLYAKMCNNGIWASDWTQLGAPASGINYAACGQGTVLLIGDTINVFVAGKDNQLYASVWNNTWSWVLLGQPPGGLSVTWVDNAVAPAACTVIAGGNPWNVGFANGWVWIEAPGLAMQNRTNSVMTPVPPPGFIVMFFIDTGGNVYAGNYVNAGISSDGRVQLGFHGAIDPNQEYGIRGTNPDMSSAHCSVFLTTEQSGPVNFDLRQQGNFQPGAICWAYMGDNGYLFVGGRESEANFNYWPGSGQGVGYMVSVKDDNGDDWYSFSDCSNYS